MSFLFSRKLVNMKKKYYDQLHSMHFIESTKKPSSSLQPAFRAHYYS